MCQHLKLLVPEVFLFLPVQCRSSGRVLSFPEALTRVLLGTPKERKSKGQQYTLTTKLISFQMFFFFSKTNILVELSLKARNHPLATYSLFSISCLVLVCNRSYYMNTFKVAITFTKFNKFFLKESQMNKLQRSAL